MKWVIIFFLADGLEHVHGKIEICDYAKIDEQVEIFEKETKKDVKGWGCYDEKTFIIRQKARESLGIDV